MDPEYEDDTDYENTYYERGESSAYYNTEYDNEEYKEPERIGF